MAKTVLITGASSGIGRAAAKLFRARGWNVAAAMRSPEKESELKEGPGFFIPRLDVTDTASIHNAVNAVMERFGPIDVVVNNAGYGLIFPFEKVSRDQVARQFATNVFGPMEILRTVLPSMRQRRQGILINVASVGGQMTFPLYSLYHATKWSLEGFSEALRYELEPLGVSVKIVEPGPIKTDFYSRSADMTDPAADALYGKFSKTALGRMERFVAIFGSRPEAAARVIYRAATDGRKKLRYPAGWAAGWLLFFRKLLPFELFSRMVYGVTAGWRSVPGSGLKS